ncbi:MAG: hypothetical protein GX110_11185 [Synergistaceae bacterium]|nr:hypothetical protein [Synergistaceae bacterium]
MNKPFQRTAPGVENPGFYSDELFAPKDSPSGKNTEDDIRSFTQNLLDGENRSAVITKDGQILPRNTAMQGGEKDFTELYKERVWG